MGPSPPGRRAPASGGGAAAELSRGAPRAAGALHGPHLFQAFFKLPRSKGRVPFQLERHSSGAEARHLGATMAVKHSKDVAVVAEVFGYVRVLLQAWGSGPTARCQRLGRVLQLARRSEATMQARSGPQGAAAAP